MSVNKLAYFYKGEHKDQEDLTRDLWTDSDKMPAIWLLHRPQSLHLNMVREKVLETQVA